MDIRFRVRCVGMERTLQDTKETTVYQNVLLPYKTLPEELYAGRGTEKNSHRGLWPFISTRVPE